MGRGVSRPGATSLRDRPRVALWWPQMGDSGLLVVPGPSGAEAAAQLAVRDCQKAAGGAVFVHACEVTSGSLRLGDTVRGPGTRFAHPL
jgi:hypothetical protein